MATNLTKLPLIRAVSTRGYSSATPVCGIINYNVKSSELPNKLVVTSADNESPISRVSITFRAGSRNETPDNAGVAHVLRICAGLSTRNATQFAITRNIQQVGANLTATADRETISYTLEGTRAAIETVLPFLTEVATQQVFKPWEVSDNVPRLRYELATRPPQLRAIDLFHKAAFRTGLGNSLFIAKYQLGKISSETLQHYVASNFTSARCSVTGLGVDHADLCEYAQKLALESGEGCTPPSPYKGGEIRSDKGGSYAFVAIGGEGGALSNQKEALASLVLKGALGRGPQVKYGIDNGILTKSIGDAGSYGIAAFNANYTETGIVGALIAAPAEIAGKVVKGAAKALKSGQVSDADVIRGKNQLKRAILTRGENGTKAIQMIGSEAALLRTATSPTQLASLVDGVSTADVNAALKKVSKKLTIASVGNLRTVPFLDELK